MFIVFITLVSCNNNTKSDSILLDKSKESCLVCHGNLKGFSDAHDPSIIGCSSCHLGNVFADDKDLSHKDMIKIPGNLSNAAKTCSSTQCHSSELHRINNSLMTTNSGIVSIDKFAFEEVSSSDTFFHIENISNSAADRHLKNLCFKCHLGYEKKHYSKTSQLSRGGGCLACHLNHKEGVSIDINDDFHPALNLNIGNDKCFGCHSRSARISTNYEGWYETLYTEKDIKDSNNYRILNDGRVFGFANEDVHHKAGLLCIDCHVSQEIMGDGKIYKHEHEAVKIQCVDCHTKSKHKTIEKSKSGSIAALDYVLRKYKYPADKFLITEKDSLPLVNSFFDSSGQVFLISKISQRKHMINPVSEKCKKDQNHENLDCNMCHASWVPTCIGCHTGYDDKVKIKGKEWQGKWYEMLGEFGKSKPVMGARFNKDKKTIVPAIPGMIMTLDKSNFHGVKSGSDSIFYRLFAPISPHTTVSNARSCMSCHNNPEAMGYGKGKLKYIIKNNTAKWIFESLYDVSEQDSLPQDSWISFLSIVDLDRKYSAHEDFLPLSLVEQKNILRVGACLECHQKENDFEDKLITDYEKMLKNKSVRCVLPF